MRLHVRAVASDESCFLPGAAAGDGRRLLEPPGRCVFPQHGPGLEAHDDRSSLEPWQTTIALDEHPGHVRPRADPQRRMPGVNRVRGRTAASHRVSALHVLATARTTSVGCSPRHVDRLGIASRRMNRWNQSVNDRASGRRRLDAIVGAKYCTLAATPRRVPGAGLEPARPLGQHEFESFAYANVSPPGRVSRPNTTGR